MGITTMRTLKEDFENYMAEANAHVARDSPQWLDLRNAFYAGAIVMAAQHSMDRETEAMKYGWDAMERFEACRHDK
jgi:6-phosphogluconate dehydrogenase